MLSAMEDLRAPLVIVVLLVIATGRLFVGVAIRWELLLAAGVLSFLVAGPIRWEIESRRPYDQRVTMRIVGFCAVIGLALLGLLGSVVVGGATASIVDATVHGMLIGLLVVLGLERTIPTLPPRQLHR